MRIWGFEKNFKKSDRTRFIALADVSRSMASPEARLLQGRIVDEVRVKRWMKREARQSAESPGFGKSIIPFLSEMPCAPVDNAKEGKHKGSPEYIPEHGFKMNRTSSMTKFETDARCCNEVSYRIRDSSINETATISLLGPAFYASLTSSPSIAAIIGALTLATYDIQLPPDIHIAQDSEPASEDDLMQICEILHTSPAEDNLHSLQLDHTSSNSVNCSKAVHQQPKSMNSFLGMQALPSLLSQLSPFPQDATSLLKTKEALSVEVARKMEPRYYSKFKELNTLTPAQTVELVSGMQQIADAYYFEALDSPAESWYRRIVTARQRIPNHEPLETLGACLRVINAIYYQERYTEAHQLHQDFHNKVQKHVPAGHAIFISSKIRRAGLLGRFGYFRQEDIERREVLQTCLCTFGVRHQHTLLALRDLGSCLRDQALYAEAEAILKTALQIMNENEGYCPPEWTNIQAVAWDILLELARCSRLQKKYEEAECVLQNLKERYGHSISDDDSRWFEFHCEMAYLLFKIRRFQESEDVLRALLTEQKQVKSLDSGWLASARDLLGRLCYGSGKLVEAAFWYQQALQLRVNALGLNHYKTLDSCRCLGFSYSKQKLWNKALELFRQTIRHLEVELIKDQQRYGILNLDSVHEVHRWIQVVENWKANEESFLVDKSFKYGD